MKTLFTKSIVLCLVALTIFGCGTSRFASPKHSHLNLIKVDPTQPESDKKFASQKAGKPAEEKELAAFTPAQEQTEAVSPAAPSTAQPVQTKPAVSSAETTKAENPVHTDTPRVETATEETATPAGDIQGTQDTTDDDRMILLVILAILLPPLAVYLAQGVGTWFWVTLLLCLFGGGFLWVGAYFGGLWLVAIILALLVVFGEL